MLYPNLSVNEEGHLCFGGQDVCTLARQYGTGLMLVDEDLIRSRCREYKEAMAEFLPAGSHPLYASKALCFKGIYEIMKEEGMGIDVVSGGEIYTAKAAGYPMEEAYFHGNSKTDREIAFAMDTGVGSFVCDNTEELDAIDAEAGRRGIRQRVLLRLTPGIDPHTHEKINTGRIDCKFGVAVETGQAEELIKRALDKKNILLEGYHCHIGSQVFEPSPFTDAAKLMLSFAAEIREKTGYAPSVLNLGGGMGVPYVKEDGSISYRDMIRTIGTVIYEACEGFGLTPPVILMEPGRSIVADAGMTVYSVVSSKTIPGFKNYLSVDGGMSDNPRYTLYQAQYTIVPASRMKDTADYVCTVAGCCCESGDLIQEDVVLPRLGRGDLVAVLTTGAYNYSMASNYNRVPRLPLVMLKGGSSYVAVRRETYEDLLRCDS